jgi:hypothetical protein
MALDVKSVRCSAVKRRVPPGRSALAAAVATASSDPMLDEIRPRPVPSRPDRSSQTEHPEVRRLLAFGSSSTLRSISATASLAQPSLNTK